MPRADGDLHAARILLPASLAVLEAFKLEGRLVVPATFGGPMQSKFRLFVGSVLLLALPAFGQASEPTPAATTAAPVVELEGGGPATEFEKVSLQQYGDGVYALRLRSKRALDLLFDTVGFVRVTNQIQCPKVSGTLPGEQGGCDESEWVLSVDKMNQLGKGVDGKVIAAVLPLPKEYDSKLVFLGPAGTLIEAAKKFSASSEGKALAGDEFSVFRVNSVYRELEGCGTRIEDINCPEVRHSIDSSSPAPK